MGHVHGRGVSLQGCNLRVAGAQRDAVAAGEPSGIGQDQETGRNWASQQLWEPRLLGCTLVVAESRLGSARTWLHNPRMALDKRWRTRAPLAVLAMGMRAAMMGGSRAVLGGGSRICAAAEARSRLRCGPRAGVGAEEEAGKDSGGRSLWT